MGSKEKLKSMIDNAQKKESKRKKRHKKKLANLKKISVNCPFCGRYLEHCHDAGTHPERNNLWLLILQEHDCVKGGRTFKETKDPLIVEKETGAVFGSRIKVRKDIYCDIGLFLVEEQKKPVLKLDL